MQHRYFNAPTEAIGDREVRAVISTSAIARDGHVLEASGAQLDNFRKNPIGFFQHRQDQPVNRWALQRAGDAIIGTATFPPAGVSALADQVLGLIKNHIINSVSVGFEPLESEPLDPKKPRGGQRITRWELYEVSWVGVPSDTNAIVTQRMHRAGKVLSAANETLLRAAHNDAELCHGLLRGVLAAAVSEGFSDGETDGDRSARGAWGRAGKMLSAANEAALKQAHAAAVRCHEGIRSVLAAAVSDGLSDGESDGDRSADYERRQRQTEALRLAPPPLSLAEEDVDRRARQVEMLQLGDPCLLDADTDYPARQAEARKLAR